jgi:DHA1 family multidrug resistance protein-like MFS transporter
MPGWKRTFWVVFAANLLSAAGLMSFLPFFPTLLEELGVADQGARATWSGILFGAAPLSAAFMGPMWGTIGDRYGRKLMVVRALAGIAVFVGAMTWATTPWQLLFLRIGQGVFSGYIPPSMTLVSLSAPAGREGSVTSALQTASTIGTIAGPVLGALLLGSLGVHALFALVGIGAVLSAIAVSLLAEEGPAPRAAMTILSAGMVLSAAWQDLIAFLRLPALRLAVLVYASVHFAMGATNPLMEFLVEDLWRGDPARVEGLTGTIFSAFALASIVGTPLWGRIGDRVGHTVTLRTASALSALSLLAHAVVPSYAGLLALRIVFGLAMPGASAAAFALAATETGPERRGSAMGAVFSARALAISAGSFGAGALMAALSLRGLYLVAGGTIVVTLLAVRRRPG